MLEVYSRSDIGTYRGISKAYFPKWEGWRLEGEAKDKAVENFYMIYFYYNMKLDLLENQTFVNLIMNFATLHGKRKAISKLQKVSGFEMTGQVSSDLITYINDNAEYLIFKYILEIVEFYSFINEPQNQFWAVNAYRKYT